MFESINRYLGRVNSVSPGSIEESRSFVSLLKSGLWLSAMLEPDSGEDDHFVRSNLTSRRKTRAYDDCRGARDWCCKKGELPLCSSETRS